MANVESFIYTRPGEEREILFYFHQLLTEEMGLEPKIRFKIPFYFNRSWVCYLNPIKQGGIELAFLRGRELSNVQGLLVSKGRKQVYGIDCYSLAEIPREAIYEIIQEAILLDES
ncbi:MAG: DUF1801 domain-containing protein [Bacteroidota bacterium]